MKGVHLANLDLNLLRVFAVVYRERHLTRAGRALFISQSAVSHSLARLRALFDDPLFVRTPEGMAPTALADRLAVPIRNALQSVSEALHVSEQFDPALTQREFSLGTTMLQPFHFLAPFYRRIEVEAPQATVLLRTLTPGTPEVPASLDSGELDLLVTVAQREAPTLLESQRFLREDLFEDPLVCVVSRRNRTVGDAIDVEQYARLPHLIMASDRVTRTWIDDALAQRGLSRRITLTAPQPHALSLLLGSTRLIATVARSLVLPYVQRGELRMLEPPITGARHVFQMIWSSRADRDPALQWLRAVARESCNASQLDIQKTAVPAPARRPAKHRNRRGSARL